MTVRTYDTDDDPPPPSCYGEASEALSERDFEAAQVLATLAVADAIERLTNTLADVVIEALRIPR